MRRFKKKGKQITKKKFSYSIKLADFYYKKTAQLMLNRVKNETTLKQEESKKNNIKKTEKKIFKLSNKEKFELKNIIDKISNLEDEINHLNEILLQNPANSQEIIIKLSNLAKDLSLAEERWQYLEELNNN